VPGCALDLIKPMKNCFLFLCLSSLVIAPPTALSTDLSPNPAEPSPPTAEIWSFDVVPYLWLATYDGTIELPGAPAGIAKPRTTTTDPFSTRISAAAMLTAQIRYRDVGLMLDGAWLRLSTDGDAQSSLYSGAEIQSDIAYGMAAFTYLLPQTGKLQSQLLAGARTWYMSHEIEFLPGTAPGKTSEDSRTWCDPIVGADLRYGFSKHWFARVIGDVGGFGVGSDLSWELFGGVGYQFTSWFSATLGYRYLHVDYEDGGFVTDLNVQGALLGLGFRF
jgi:opacity protein-like surface antigen